MELMTISRSTCPACFRVLRPKRVQERIAHERRIRSPMIADTFLLVRGCRVTASEAVRDLAKAVVCIDDFSFASVTNLFETHQATAWTHAMKGKCDPLALGVVVRSAEREVVERWLRLSASRSATRG